MPHCTKHFPRLFLFNFWGRPQRGRPFLIFDTYQSQVGIRSKGTQPAVLEVSSKARFKAGSSWLQDSLPWLSPISVQITCILATSPVQTASGKVHVFSSAECSQNLHSCRTYRSSRLMAQSRPFFQSIINLIRPRLTGPSQLCCLSA